MTRFQLQCMNLIAPRACSMAARLIGILVFAVSPAASAAAPDAAWPALPVPSKAQMIEVGEQAMSVNGVPMTMNVFLAAELPHRIADWYRRTIRTPLVESRAGDMRILGGPHGRHYLTVQLTPVPGGTRGIVALSDLPGAEQAAKDTPALRWRSRLPAGSTLVSEVVTEDAGKLGRQMFYVNRHNTALNRDRVAALLKEEGLDLVREANFRPTADAARFSASRVLIFNGKGKEATAVITRDASGRTSVVLNIITSVERLE